MSSTHRTALSVNLNKVALVRNTRHLGIPSVTAVCARGNVFQSCRRLASRTLVHARAQEMRLSHFAAVSVAAGRRT